MRLRTNARARWRTCSIPARADGYEKRSRATTNHAERTQLPPRCQTGRRAALLGPLARSARGTKNAWNAELFRGADRVELCVRRACKTNPIARQVRLHD